jgi:WD40 repeat protein
VSGESGPRRRSIWALAALLALLILSLAALVLSWGARAGGWWARTAEPTLLPATTVELGRLVPLTNQNVSGLAQLARWGRGQVIDVAYSRDGQLLAVASSVGVFVYASSGDRGGQGQSTQVPDDTLEPIRFIETGAPVWSLAFSSAADSGEGLLAGGLADGRVRLWRVADGSLVRTLEGHNYGVISVAFGPRHEELLLASASADRTVRLWRVNDGQTLAILEGHAHVVEQVAFSPATGSQEGLLASASMDGTVGLWHVSGCGHESGPCGVLAHTLRGSATTLNSLSFSLDGTLLAAGSAEGVVQLWRIAGCAPGGMPQTAQECGALLHTLVGPGDGVSAVAFTPRLGSALLAAGGMDGTLQLWDTSACTAATSASSESPLDACARLVKALPVHEGAVNGLAFSPDGDSLVTSGLDQTVRVWAVSGCAPDLAETCGAPLRTLEGYSGRVNGVAFSPDGKLLAAGLEGHAAGLWRVSDCLTDPKSSEAAECGPPLHPLGGHTGDVDSVAFSPDGSILATGDSKRVDLGVWDSTVRLWRVSDGVLLQTWPGQRTDMGSCAVYRHSIAFSPQDGALVASGSHDNLVRLWRASDGQLLRALPGHQGALLSVAFSPDGQRLASAAWEDETVQLWDVAGCSRGPEACGTRPLVLEGHAGIVLSVAFSPSGELLASGAADGTLRLWRASNGAALHAVTGDAGALLGLAFSPDGKLLASGGVDGSVQVWQVSGCGAWSRGCGTLLHTSKGHTGRVNSVAFSPDGALLASGSDDGTLRLWGVVSRGD